MSGPFSFTVTVISGQRESSSLVIGASAFLYRGWMSVHPVSTNKNIRDELFLSLDVFSERGYFTYAPEITRAKGFAQRMEIIPSINYSCGLFWIALDKQGYSIAAELLPQNGIKVDEKVYKSVCKLNLVKRPMPPYPEEPAPPEYWREILHKFYSINNEYKEVNWKVGRQALYEKYAPMTVLEQKYYSWYKLLQDNLLSWREMIGEIQSAWS